MNRRQFLKQASTYSGMAAIGAPSLALATSPWGTLPLAANSTTSYNILEIFCPGGFSQWENFWVSHDGQNGNLNWRGLQDFVEQLTWLNCDDLPSATQTKFFANSYVNGEPTPVSWGPATKPLWRDDIFNRCRMVVTKHSEQLHAFGAYRTFTGRQFGNPRGAGVGAAIQRFHQAQPNPIDIPYSYVLAPDHSVRSYFMTQPAEVGQHPGSSRPLILRVGQSIDDLLARPGISGEADAVFGHLREQYQDMLRWQGNGAVTRAADFSNYNAAAHYLVNAVALDSVLGGSTLEATNSSVCAEAPGHEFGSLKNPTEKSLEVAAMLFAEGAKHVTVIDGGFNTGNLQDGSMAYDSHHRPGSKNVVEMTSANLFNLLSSLEKVIKTPGNGGIIAQPVAPGIDLDNTLVVINTEFNRTPNPGINTDGDFHSCGREHFPAANLSILIGGPVTSRQIKGGIGLDEGNYNTAVASNSFTPTDVHAAMLFAAGIDPLALDNFTNGDDFSPQINPGGNALSSTIYSNLKNKVLGESDIGNTIQWG